MRKPILTVILIAISFLSFSQSASEKTETTRISNIAKKWFKDFYVQTTFKDPYSYKLMKFTLSPISNKEALMTTLDKYEGIVRDLDTTSITSDYKTKKQQYIFDRNFNTQMRKTDSISLKYNAHLYEELMVSKKAYEDAILERDKTKSLLDILTEAQAKKLYTYQAYIECYGRNGYGNIVLSKYIFEVDLKGNCSNIRNLD